MDGEKFDDLLKRLCATRLTRISALRGLVAGAAAALTGATLASDDADAKKRGKGKSRKGKGKGKSSKGKSAKGAAKTQGGANARTATTPVACACADNLSPKQCPAQSGNNFTCKLCDKIVSGSVQVECGANGPTCICQPTGNGKGAGCDIRTATGTVNIRPGKPVPQCSAVACPKSDCNDNATCTTDRCNRTTGFCENTPDDSRCGDGTVCTTDVCDPGDPNADPVTGCVNAPIDCDDDIFCTVDSCDPADGCVNTRDDSLCDDGAVCEIAECKPGDDADDNGCVYTPDDSRCDDRNACTTDACDPDSEAAGDDGCTHTPVDCDDDIYCTVDSCDPDTGCVNTNDDSRCNDNNVCTRDVCRPGSEDAGDDGCVHIPIDCDDGIACTVDTCDPETGCANTPDDDLCDDNDVCTTDVCDPESGTADGCTHTPISCDDGIVCTADSCDSVDGCQNVPTNSLCPARTGCDAICDPVNGDANGCVYVNCICYHSAPEGEPRDNCKDACVAATQGDCQNTCEDLCGPLCPNPNDEGGQEERVCLDGDACDSSCFTCVNNPDPDAPRNRQRIAQFTCGG